MAGSYLVPWHPRPDSRPLLLCLPPAGAGCGQFRMWQRTLGDSVSVVGVQLPGRESRFAEPEPPSFDAAVAAIAAELAALVPAEHPVVVFGHSFGALIGYQTVRRLRAGRGQNVRALAVAACRAPDRWIGAGRGLAGDDEALAGLLADRGLGEDDIDEDSREALLDVLRRDVRLSLSFGDSEPGPVDCAVHAWGGEQDRTVTAEDLAGWQDYAAAGFQRREFPGGHYFCLQEPGTVLGPLAALTEPGVLAAGERTDTR